MSIGVRMGKSLKKILFGDEMITYHQATLLKKARGFPPGTIREWSGKKYRKGSNGKWAPVGGGKPSESKTPDKVPKGKESKNKLPTNISNEIASWVRKNGGDYKGEEDGDWEANDAMMSHVEKKYPEVTKYHGVGKDDDGNDVIQQAFYKVWENI